METVQCLLSLVDVIGRGSWTSLHIHKPTQKQCNTMPVALLPLPVSIELAILATTDSIQLLLFRNKNRNRGILILLIEMKPC